MMRVLCTGDWHGDVVTAGLDRYSEIESAAMRTVDVAVERKVDLYVFLGDLCDPDDPKSHRAVALAIRVQRELSQQQIRSLWIAGNHDVIEDGTGATTLSPVREAADNWSKVCELPTLPLPFGVLALPYTARSHAYDPESFVRTSEPDVNLVVGHLTVPGAGPGSEVMELPRGREVMLPVEAIRERWPYAVVVNGHHHNAQVAPGGVHIPGNLCRLTHGEEKNDPGFLILEVP